MPGTRLMHIFRISISGTKCTTVYGPAHRGSETNKAWPPQDTKNKAYYGSSRIADHVTWRTTVDEKTNKEKRWGLLNGQTEVKPAVP